MFAIRIIKKNDSSKFSNHMALYKGATKKKKKMMMMKSNSFEQMGTFL